MKTSTLLNIVKSFVLVVASFTIYSCTSNDSKILQQQLNQNWTLSTDTLNTNLTVEVPSIVQTDLYAHGIIKHPYQDSIEKSLYWITEQNWSYALLFDVEPQLLQQEHLNLVFEGINGFAEVLLNDSILFQSDNMFQTHEIEVKNIIKSKNNHLQVNILPYYKNANAKYEALSIKLPERYSVARTAAYQHGWDWAPRYTNVGIWKPIFLQAWSQARLTNSRITTQYITDNQAKLQLKADFESTQNEPYIINILLDNQLITSQATNGTQQDINIDFVVKNPQLWWPNEIGEQNMYQFNVQLLKNKKVIDSKIIKTGIRTIELIDEPDSIGRRMYFKVNGQETYAKGSNYVPENMFTTWMQRDVTRNLLQQCADAHFNMLRIWGGGIYPYDYFFEICDSLGIMVWEDFMFAGTLYPFDDAFLESVEKEATKHIKAYASHPSLALWCGNNEVSEGYYNWGWQKSLNWSAEDDSLVKAGYDKLFEQMLPQLVKQHDGSRSYWSSSPSKGWGRKESLTEGDVHYWGVWWGDSLYQTYKNKVGRFNSEFGYQALPEIKTLNYMSTTDTIVLNDAVLKAHEKHVRGFDLIELQLKEYFPPYSNLNEYAYLSQVSQAFGVGMAIEAQRSRKPYSMGSLYWQVNDAWPVISWSSIDYFGRKKALHYRLNDLFANILIGNKVIVNDLQKPFSGELRAYLMHTNSNIIIDSMKTQIEITANGTIGYASDFETNTTENNKTYIVWQLYEKDKLAAQKIEYLVKPKNLILSKQNINYSIKKQDDATIAIHLSTNALMKDVCISSNVSGSFSDNYFDLIPLSDKTVIFTPETPQSTDDIQFNFITINSLMK